ncbi:SNF2-related protein [Burkholderia sp. Bp8998]|uniref:SNF2-related protein n=1 Tax=Burkholderia sp. Bp8998 TaxID=2184557 RepID=UPI000F5AA338|nr:ATP-dependent helicase [Burkholderia sp. Bp8998]
MARVVVDEAQNIKSPVAAQTRAIKSLSAPAFIAMSGTPVENHLAEYGLSASDRYSFRRSNFPQFSI